MSKPMCNHLSLHKVSYVTTGPAELKCGKVLQGQKLAKWEMDMHFPKHCKTEKS